MNKLGLYIHIPFCVRKCRYCDFLSFDDRHALIGPYITELKKEIGEYAREYSEYVIGSIYIGGGTPSVLNAETVGELLELVRSLYRVGDDAEISIEVNPGSVTEEKAARYRKYGINRLSIGLQSARDDELVRLGRIHTWNDFLKTYDLARNNGFDNINIDIISAIPGQDIRTYEETLRKVIGLEPEHISAYSLQLEEGTYFYEHRDDYDWPDEETDREMYHLTGHLISEAGYDRYEISNYSKPGRECRHNLIYWSGDSYLGFGIGSASYIPPRRFKNTDSPELYLKGERVTENTVLSNQDMMEEFMFLGLRRTCGISRKEFERRFGTSINDIYRTQLDRYLDEGLIRIKDDNIRLTELGLDVSNYVFAGFLL